MLIFAHREEFVHVFFRKHHANYSLINFTPTLHPWKLPDLKECFHCSPFSYEVIILHSEYGCNSTLWAFMHHKPFIPGKFSRKGYLDEFCYKMNRHYMSDLLFERLLFVCVYDNYKSLLFFNLNLYCICLKGGLK